MNLILMQNGYVLTVIRVENRAKYIQAIEKAQNGESLNEFHKVIADKFGFNI